MAKSTPKSDDQPAAGGTTGTDVPAVRWDGSEMQTGYANVCNVSSTREEFTLLFGTNQTWDPQSPRVQLSERIVLSPYVAKRLATLIDTVVEEYEKRWGGLDIG